MLVEETFARSRLVRIGNRGQQEGSRKMRSNRRRNWFIKRFALGLAIAAVAAPVAQAKIDEARPSRPTATSRSSRTSRRPRRSTRPSRRFGSQRAAALDPERGPTAGNQIEVVRAQPRANPSDKIEFVRTQPRSIGGPQVVAAGFDWKDAGIGAGLALALVLLGAGAALASRHVGRTQTA